MIEFPLIGGGGVGGASGVTSVEHTQKYATKLNKSLK